ncbi:hypothetical protein MRX96_033304 [Rhipicephalus microplus]
MPVCQSPLERRRLLVGPRWSRSKTSALPYDGCEKSVDDSAGVLAERQRRPSGKLSASSVVRTALRLSR